MFVIQELILKGSSKLSALLAITVTLELPLPVNMISHAMLDTDVLKELPSAHVHHFHVIPVIIVCQGVHLRGRCKQFAQ